jgi:hypothetical protein
MTNQVQKYTVESEDGNIDVAVTSTLCGHWVSIGKEHAIKILTNYKIVEWTSDLRGYLQKNVN